jgi:magnesium transporter
MKREGDSMTRYLKKISRKAGLPPGTLVHIGDKMAAEVRITVMDYDKHRVSEREVHDIRECFAYRDTPTVSWINIDGLHDTQLIEQLGAHFGFHPLLLEDIVNTGGRPKIEDFDEYVFVVLKMLYQDPDDAGRIVSEHMSLIFGENYVISFQEREGDVFDPIRRRILAAAGRVRKQGADYLAYRLMDAVVDNYFNLIETIGEQVEKTEDILLNNPGKETLQTIHRLKGETLFLRKSVWPLREIIGYLERGESDLVKPGNSIYFKDVYDHTVQVMDTLETFRDIIAGMMDIYLSSVSNRMNEIMKILTVFAAIFIPLTFLAGVYGMNFEHMPELHWRWSYPALWAVMAGIALSLLLMFKKRGWL